jgi:uncharacterized protein (TIGR02270 family)
MSVASAIGRPSGPIWRLVEGALDEAEFLWQRWQAMLWTHAYDLDGVSFWVEERLLGALDGLRVGGEAALDSLLIPALGADDRFRAAVAAHLLATSGQRRVMDALVAAVRESNGARLIALEQGLQVVRSKAVFGILDDLLVRAGPAHWSSALRMQAFQQRDPGAQVEQALASDDAALQTAALQALRHTTAIAGAVAVERHLGASDPTVRDAAIETGLVRGIGAAWARCRELAASSKADAGPALLLVALLGLAEDQETILKAVADEVLKKDALFALGFAGTRAAADICVETMATGVQAQLAAEAFTGITGLDLTAERLVAASPVVEREEPIPFEEEDLDANLVPTPADLLPWPDVAGVIRWWNANRARFVAGQRYIRGAPADLTALQRALVQGSMRRRHAIALELAVRTGGRYQVETRALTATQRRQMETFELLGAAGMRRSRLKSSFSPA